MPNFDPIILKRNISKLMKDKGIKQQQLAEILGMSQSNVSKALSERDKKCFTIEQLYSIAAYFGVSTDQLLGLDTAYKVAKGPRAIASFLAELLADGTAKLEPVTINEEVFEVFFDHHEYESRHEKRDIQYQAIYFPNYWSPSAGTSTEEEYEENYSIATQCGNDTKNVPINQFFEKYAAILHVYEEKAISEEAFQIVCKDYLNQLEET